MVLGYKEVRFLLILSIFAKTISDFPSIFLSRHARQRSARQRQDLKRSARRLACLALKARDKETMCPRWCEIIKTMRNERISTSTCGLKKISLKNIF